MKRLSLATEETTNHQDSKHQNPCPKQRGESVKSSLAAHVDAAAYAKTDYAGGSVQVRPPPNIDDCSVARDPRIPGLDTGTSLDLRSCTYNGCECNSRGEQLTVCGNCVWNDGAGYIVTTKRVGNHIFECSLTDSCRDYGVARDCGTASARCKIDK